MASESADEPCGQGDYVVGPGDCIHSIAAKALAVLKPGEAEPEQGLWQDIWQHGGNAELREKRKNAGTLLEGDRVTIPERAPLDPLAGKHHRMIVRAQYCALRLKLVGTHPRLNPASQVEGGDGLTFPPLADKPWEIVVGDYSVKGRTDADGLLEAKIPARATDGLLYIGAPGERICFALKLGSMPPASTVRGAQQRLAALGLGVGTSTQEGETEQGLDAATKSALSTFQSAAQLTVTGELDQATQDKLIEHFGI